LENRSGLYKQFEGLFNQEEQDEDVGDSPTDGNRQGSFAEAQRVEEDRKQNKWNWISIIYRLCNGDITKTEQVVSKPFIECLVWMSFEKETNK
jgi:hypothetical protein